MYGYGGFIPKKQSSSAGIAFLLVLIFILFTIGGIGFATSVYVRLMQFQMSRHWKQDNQLQ